MKYCVKCGAELIDEAVVCTKCGCLINNDIINNKTASNVKKKEKNENGKTEFYLGLLTLILSIIGLASSIISWILVLVNSQFAYSIYTIFLCTGLGTSSILAITIGIKNIIHNKNDLTNLLGIIFGSISVLSNICYALWQINIFF